MADTDHVDRGARSADSSYAPWRAAVARALHAGRAGGGGRRREEYFQLASVGVDGWPANRTVVFRGFLEHPDCLIATTDARSRKIEEIGANPAVEACWYFGQTREQFRFRGTASLVEAGDPSAERLVLRDHVWHELSGSTRVQFAWPEPGAPRAERAAFDIPAPAKASPPAEFCLLIIEPTRVDHLELAPSPHTRLVYQRQPDGRWTVREVNP